MQILPSRAIYCTDTHIVIAISVKFKCVATFTLLPSESKYMTTIMFPCVLSRCMATCVDLQNSHLISWSTVVFSICRDGTGKNGGPI